MINAYENNGLIAEYVCFQFDGFLGKPALFMSHLSTHQIYISHLVDQCEIQWCIFRAS